MSDRIEGGGDPSIQQGSTSPAEKASSSPKIGSCFKSCLKGVKALPLSLGKPITFSGQPKPPPSTAQTTTKADDIGGAVKPKLVLAHTAEKEALQKQIAQQKAESAYRTKRDSLIDEALSLLKQDDISPDDLQRCLDKAEKELKPKDVQGLRSICFRDACIIKNESEPNPKLSAEIFEKLIPQGDIEQVVFSKQLDELEGKMNANNDKITSNKQKVEELIEMNRGDRKEINKMRKNVAGIEEEIVAMSKMEKLEEPEDFANKLSKLEGQIKHIKEEISMMSEMEGVDGLEEKIAGRQGQINALQKEIDALSEMEGMVDLEEKIAEREKQADDLEDAMYHLEEDIKYRAVEIQLTRREIPSFTMDMHPAAIEVLDKYGL